MNMRVKWNLSEKKDVRLDLEKDKTYNMIFTKS